MSHEPISRSPDLKRLRDEGYEVEIRADHLLVKHIPYVNSRKEIKYGTVISTLKITGTLTETPETHVMHFIGEYPCSRDGVELSAIRHQDGETKLADGLVSSRSFSSKPEGGYKDYYEKMVTYIRILSNPARAIDPDVTAMTFPALPAAVDEGPFHYHDTASSRAGIGALSHKLSLNKVAIVGLGGTGSYVLDLVAKTPVKEIHLFDGDVFSNHNAFRSPGAPSLAELEGRPTKVAHLKKIYSNMHRGIVAHEYFINAGTVAALAEMDFVFICSDEGAAKRLIVERLEQAGLPFIDVGMGVEMGDDSLGGLLRVTTSTKDMRSHVRDRNRITFSDGNGNDAYSKNIQIADLNALNAAFAVIRWKKLFGFYLDTGHEYFSAYSISSNVVVDEDKQ